MSAVVLVTRVGAAAGARAAAAALACAGAEPDRAGLLVDLGAGRGPRPALIASAAARELEERLAAHLPDAGVASRGRICHLTLPPEEAGIERLGAALAVGRELTAAVHLPPHLLQAALASGQQPGGALLRADLPRDRALTGLVVGDLLARGIVPAVLKQPLSWIAARRALAGAPAAGVAAAGLTQPSCRRLLAA